MTSFSGNQTSDINSDAASALIEAQDIEFLTPLREFLIRYGCNVVTGRSGGGSFLYAIGVGSSEFVKTFFSNPKLRAQKKLAVIYEGEGDGLALLRAKGVKLYFIDPKPLTDSETRAIFSFFFTSKAESNNVRKEPILTKQSGVTVKEPSREPQESAKEQLIRDTTRISQTIAAIFTYGGKASRTKPSKVSVKATRLFVGICIALLLPIILYTGSLLFGLGFLAASGKALLAGNLYWTQNFVGYSKTQIQNARTILDITSPAVHFLGLGGYVEDEDRLLGVANDALLAESGVVAIFERTKDVGSTILFPKNSSAGASVSDVTTLTDDVSKVSQHLALVQAELDSLLASPRAPFRFAGIQSVGNRGIAALRKVRTLIGFTQNLLSLYPQMGGFRKRQTYLVLLQNSTELRPTGGFIGSVLLVSFVDGKVDDMHVLDVYSADGQLKGHVDPPLPIREIIGQEHWYLRDSNWDPNFHVSGYEAGWFYEKEMSEQVDGVIAVSLPMVTNLLHVTGPIDLPDFHERISESNFFAKSLLYTQTDFFPGSTQKKDFLGALTTAMLMRLTSDNTISAGQLLKSVTDSIQSRDIQFYFDDPALEQLVTQWGWDGGIRLGQCQNIVIGTTCAGDGVGVVEANLGMNKVNFFVTHEALSDVTIGADGTISETLAVKIKNGSPSQGAPGSGGYQDYFRAYFPSDTSVSAVKLDGIDVPTRDMSKVTPPPAPYVIKDASGSAVSISVPISVPPGAERQILIQTARQAHPFVGSTMYQYTIRKQSGVSSFPWHVVIHYPPTWSATSEGGVANPGLLEYNTDLVSDTNIRVLFRLPQ